MSTAIAAIPSLQPLAVVGPGEFRLSNFQQVSIPGQGWTTWSWSTIIGEVVEKEIKGVCVALSDTQHDLWPTVGEATKGGVPYMRSHDNVTAYVVGNESGDLDLAHLEEAKNPDGSYDCRKIKYFQWEKREDGRNVPPRANTTSVIMILREGDASPIYIRLSKTSSPVVQKFFNELRRAGLQPYQAVVRLGLEAIKGAKANYSRVVPKFVSKLEGEDAVAFRGFFETVSPLLRSPLTKFEPKAIESEDKVPF